jgi:hypothetical protein
LKQCKKANFEPSNINKCNILRLALKIVDQFQRTAETWFDLRLIGSTRFCEEVRSLVINLKNAGIHTAFLRFTLNNKVRSQVTYMYNFQACRMNVKPMRHYSTAKDLHQK